jgi:tetratricopeptide (TPR) repeat protein
MLLGTPAYMAPEQLDGRTIDQRTDQFSFCVALYEALYGERPFAGSTIEALAFATAMGNMRPPRRDARVPSWLRRSLMRGLTADPEHRYPSMDSLLKALGRDPARSWRRWASVAAIALLALAGGGAVTAIRERSRQLCRAGDQKIAGLWDDARRGELQRAFLATGLPYAGDVWEGSRRILDPYVAGWLDMYRDTCEATHLRGEQSPELLDLRMRCLEHRRQELRALVDVFSAADGKVVENAVQAAQARTPLSSCVDAPTLATRVRLPEDPGMRKRVEELHTDLARVKALTDAGKFAEALPLAEAAVKAGREIGDSPLLAEALLHLEPAVSGASSQYKRSEAVLEEAVEAAIAGRDGQTLATALVTLIPIAGEHQQHFEEGHRWSRQAKAAIIALGGGQEALEATRLCNTSRVFRMQGKHSEAVQQAHQCIALKERSSGRDSLAVAAALKTLTQAQIHLGDFAQAAEQAHRATAALENLVGPRHLLVASALEQEGAARAEMKDPEGLPILLRARAVRQAVLGPDHQGVAQTESNLAMGLIQLGRLDEGLQLYDRVLTIYERTYGSTSWKIFFALYWIGEAHLRKGDVQDALKYARRGWAVGVKVLGPDHPGLAGPLLTEGKALLAAGDASRAVPKLEQSLALREAADVAPYRHAESAFALARALVATRGDQKRADELAQRAQDLFHRQGKGFEDDLREVEQWQARRLASVKTR